MTVAFIKAMVMDGSGVKNIRKHVSWPERVWQVYERITGKPRPDFYRKPGQPAAPAPQGRS